jgi:23S rRNA (cytosine1962-C5)-methyltransferase
MSKRIYLKSGKENRALSGHPWIFLSDLDWAEKDVNPGDVVTVVSNKGRFLAQAVYNPKSQIALRIISTQEELVDADFFKNRVREAISLRRQLGSIGCGRLIFSESDHLPAVIADQFNDVISLQCLSLGMARFQGDIVDALVEELAPKGIWERNDVPVRTLEGMEQSTGLLYGSVPDRIEIVENGLKMLVDVKGGQKTGYFLDQKENRAAIAPYCKGARMLDICTHTGSFALHAAMYGASQVLAVDISEHAISQARENARRNGIQQAEFLTANAFDYLRDASDRNEQYDLIVLDPPAFAKNKASLDGAVRGYKEINLRAMKMLREGGVLLTCSCSQHMVPALFQDTLLKAAQDAKVSLQLIEWRSQGRDHPVLMNAPETHYLKCAILRVVR